MKLLLLRETRTAYPLMPLRARLAYYDLDWHIMTQAHYMQTASYMIVLVENKI